MKNETIIVPLRSLFSAFAVSIFMQVEIAPQFLVLKIQAMTDDAFFTFGRSRIIGLQNNRPSANTEADSITKPTL